MIILFPFLEKEFERLLSVVEAYYENELYHELTGFLLKLKD